MNDETNLTDRLPFPWGFLLFLAALLCCTDVFLFLLLWRKAWDHLLVKIGQV